MLRRFLGTRRGFWVILGLEALLLFGALPRILTGTGAATYLATFWGTATFLYFINYPLRQWLQRPKLPSD